MHQKVRVGIIGAGGIANGVHMPSLAEIEECEVVAICDLHANKAHSLAGTAKATGRIAAVAMNRRHIPVIQEVLRRLRAVTPITQIDGRFMKYSDIAECWNYASAYNCDIIHAIDLVRYIAGSEPKHAGTVIGRFDSPVDNAWSSVMEFENGILATLRANYQSAARIHDFEIHGPNACAFIKVN